MTSPGARQMDWRQVLPLAQLGYRLSHLAHTDILAIGDVDFTTDQGIAASSENNATRGFGHIGEVATVLAGAKDHRWQAIENADDEARDDLGEIASIMFARPVTVERRTTTTGSP